MKRLGLLILLFTGVYVSAQECDFELEDNIRFTRIPDMNTISDIYQLKGLTVVKTISSPQGLIFTYDLYVYIALKKGKVWEYWPVYGGLLSSDTTEAISRVDVNKQGSKELVLIMTRRDGRYNEMGGFSIDEKQIHVYDLDNRKQLLSMVKQRNYELGETWYTDRDRNPVDVDSLLNENPNADRTAIIDTLMAEGKGTRESFICEYDFDGKGVNISCHCSASDNRLNNGQPRTYAESRHYLLKPDGFIIDNSVKK